MQQTPNDHDRGDLCRTVRVWPAFPAWCVWKNELLRCLCIKACREFRYLYCFSQIKPNVHSFLGKGHALQGPHWGGIVLIAVGEGTERELMLQVLFCFCFATLCVLSDRNMRCIVRVNFCCACEWEITDLGSKKTLLLAQQHSFRENSWTSEGIRRHQNTKQHSKGLCFHNTRRTKRHHELFERSFAIKHFWNAYRW